MGAHLCSHRTAVSRGWDWAIVSVKIEITVEDQFDDLHPAYHLKDGG